MSHSELMSGQCLCGAVELSAPKVAHLEACHCKMCRRWGGGPFLSGNVEGELTIKGQEHVTVYASSEWAERAFCKCCGTHLYYRLKPAGAYAVPIGLFDDEGGYLFHEQIFVESQPTYYEFANQTAMLTEAEVMAKYGAA